MENAQTQRSIPTFQREATTKTQQKHEMGHAVNEPLPKFQRSKRPDEESHRRRRTRRQKRETTVHHKDVDSGGEDDEKAEVERKIEALQRIVPGGEALGADKLFEETAEYIMALQCQVKAMRTLANFFERLEKENMKFGG